MLFLVQMGYQDIQEWDEKVEHQKATDKTIGYRLDWPKHQQGFLHTIRLITSGGKQGIEEDAIKFHLQEQFQELSDGDMRLAHKIACYHHKTINTSLPPHAKEVEKQAFTAQWVFYKLVHQARINDIVMCYDKYHHDDTV